LERRYILKIRTKQYSMTSLLGHEWRVGEYQIGTLLLTRKEGQPIQNGDGSIRMEAFGYDESGTVSFFGESASLVPKLEWRLSVVWDNFWNNGTTTLSSEDEVDVRRLLADMLKTALDSYRSFRMLYVQAKRQGKDSWGTWRRSPRGREVIRSSYPYACQQRTIRILHVENPRYFRARIQEAMLWRDAVSKIRACLNNL
jgi:hypothetical protein